jgi:hypothetical protein
LSVVGHLRLPCACGASDCDGVHMEMVA